MRPPCWLPLLLLGCSPSPDSGPPSNILILLVDDIGVDALACYGAEGDLPHTPHIDALAEGGMRFVNAWGQPLCSPTRATIQTGRYGFRTGIGAVVTPTSAALPLDEVTLPEMLAAGRPGVYSCAAIGKWHLGNDSVGGALAPNQAGYDHFSGSLWNLNDSQGYNSWEKIVDGRVSFTERYATSDAVDSALEWVGSVQGPWLCYLAFHAAHARFHEPPAELHSRDLSGAGPPESNPRPYYLAMIEALDREIGRLLVGLGEEQLARTTVILLSDNGSSELVSEGEEGEPRTKGTLYQGGLRVPLIVNGPAVQRPGSVCRGLVHAVDLFASVAELAGVELEEALPADHPIDSISLVPYLSDPETPAGRRWVYAEIFHPNGFEPTVSHSTIRNLRHKLMVGPEPGQRRLFDLEQDPEERNDLLASDARDHRTSQICRRLQGQLQELRSDR